MDKKEILHNMRIKRDELHQIIMESVKSVLGKQERKGFAPYIETYGSMTTNTSAPIPLNETNAKRLLKRHSDNGYALLSACRGGDDFGITEPTPDNIRKVNEINNKRTLELLKDIQEAGFTYTKGFGGYIENKGKENEVAVFEKSFIVYAEKRDGVSYPEELYQFAIYVFRKYNQESVCVKLPDTNPIYYKQDESIDYEFKNGVSFNDATQTYFTDLYRINNVWREGSKATRFSLLECYIAPSPQGYSEGHSRYMHGERFLSKQV